MIAKHANLFMNGLIESLKYFEFNNLVTNFWLIKEFLDRGNSVFITTTSMLNLKNQVLQSSWDDYYQLVVAYYSHYGNSNVPQNFKTKDGITESNDEDSINLGVWCNVQRIKYSKGLLTEERYKKLKVLGFRFEHKSDLEWEEKYKLLEYYYNEYGNTEMFQNYKTKEGVALGAWAEQQRYKYKKGINIKPVESVENFY